MCATVRAGNPSPQPYSQATSRQPRLLLATTPAARSLECAAVGVPGGQVRHSQVAALNGEDGDLADGEGRH